MATVLMLSSLGLAAHETSQLGPYTASFDMNTNLKYQLQVFNPINSPAFTAYGVLISTDNATRAQVSITEYKNPTDATPAMYKQLMTMDLALVGFNTTSINDMMIDGKNGFVLSAMPFPGVNAPTTNNLYRAIYWLDSKDCSQCGPVSVGTTSVDITSTYPQDVTQGLLSSLHITKGTAPAK